jgi:hypothetical protein
MSATVGATQKVRAVGLGALDEVRDRPAAHACWQHYIHLLLGCGMASYGLLGRVNRQRISIEYGADQRAFGPCPHYQQSEKDHHDSQQPKVFSSHCAKCRTQAQDADDWLKC